MSMKSGKEFNRLKNYKVKTKQKSKITEDEHEILKLAAKYPGNPKMQSFKRNLLKKNNMLPPKNQSTIQSWQEQESSSEEQVESDQEIVIKNQRITSKLGGQNSQSTKELQKVKNTLKLC